MIKINELRSELYNYLGHNNFVIKKYTKKHDDKQEFNLVVYGYGDKENRMLPLYKRFMGLEVHLICDKANDNWFGGEALGFRTYDLICG